MHGWHFDMFQTNIKYPDFLTENFLSFLWQKVNGLGFALGETLWGTHKVQKFNLHLT